jgi:signal transduction histidine kinase
MKFGIRTGVGLRGMRERVAELGGLLKIESDTGGTTVFVFLPCGPVPVTATGAA